MKIMTDNKACVRFSIFMQENVLCKVKIKLKGQNKTSYGYITQYIQLLLSSNDISNSSSIVVYHGIIWTCLTVLVIMLN